MSKIIFAPKLNKNDRVMVIAPSCSMALNKPEKNQAAKERLEREFGIKVSFAKHSHEMDVFASSSIESRVQDLHDAFLDKSVKAIFCAKGGYNANQLLNHIDWEIIKNNPKIIIGYSDNDVLTNAIYAKTGLVTYLGPTFSFFGKDKVGMDYSINALKQCLFSEEVFDLLPSDEFTYEVYDESKPSAEVSVNPGLVVINEGKAEGRIIGGNLCTFNLLHGTDFMPKFDEKTLLFIEDDDLAGEYTLVEFERNLMSLIHQKGFENVVGLVIGRFQPTSKVEIDKLKISLISNLRLNHMPIVYGIDIGHTSPLATIPIGGDAQIEVGAEQAKVILKQH